MRKIKTSGNETLLFFNKKQGKQALQKCMRQKSFIVARTAVGNIDWELRKTIGGKSIMNFSTTRTTIAKLPKDTTKS